jgi:hypothetical protein
MLKVNQRRIQKQAMQASINLVSSPDSNDTRKQWLQSQAQGDGPYHGPQF